MERDGIDLSASPSRQKAAAQAAPLTRVAPIDFMRGLCIIGMVSWHILADPSFPKWLSFSIIQPFNFVAEGFVLLAGLSVGIAGCRRPSTSTRSLRYLRRACQILILHYAMVAVLVAAFGLGLVSLIRPSAPSSGVVGAIARLEFQPYLADVLTVFVFLFAATPVFLWIERRFGLTPLFVVSLCVYVMANAVHGIPALRFWIVLEPNRQGAFDFGSWQLVYVVGMLVGQRLESIQNAVKNNFGMALAATLALFFAAGAFRLVAELRGWGIGGQLRAALFERHPLGPARLVYILLQLAVIGILTVRFWPSLENSRIARGLMLFGRSSLAIFAVSVFADYFLRTAIARMSLAFPANIGCWLLELAALLVLAELFVRWKRFRAARA